MADSLWWLLVVAMIGAGLAGTVLPALPGTALILAGIVLGGWIDGFTRVGTFTLVVVTVLAVLSWVLEYVAGVLGARRAGASRWALIGATLGTVLGLLMGLVGVLFMPLVGAALGELWAQREARRRAGGGPAEPVVPAGAAGPVPTAQPGQVVQQDLRRALHVGVFAWLGMLAGLLAKVVLGCMMVGVFVAALAL
jgi:uncharacterized protein YqgC (DUF456 family)